MNKKELLYNRTLIQWATDQDGNKAIELDLWEGEKLGFKIATTEDLVQACKTARTLSAHRLIPNTLQGLLDIANSFLESGYHAGTTYKELHESRAILSEAFENQKGVKFKL